MIEPERIQALKVEPGDTVVFTLPERTSVEMAEGFRDHVLACLPDGVRLLVVACEVEVEVVREADDRLREVVREEVRRMIEQESARARQP